MRRVGAGGSDINLSFLFPGSGGPYEALDNLVRTLARHSRKHKVSLGRCPGDCLDAACVFVLTEGRTFPRPKCEQALHALRSLHIPWAVVHNHDHPPVPAPGDYPSFCWTERAHALLARHRPFLARLPVFPPIVPAESPPLLVATFGHCEPKKWTREMLEWAKKNDVPFRAYGPDALAERYEDYVYELRRAGGDVVIHPWAEKVEDLASLFHDVSHFLFVLPESKGGSGGCPVSPRFAGFFNRPVIVVDDESTYAEDGYHVYESLDDVNRHSLAGMRPPEYGYGVDQYLDTLVSVTLKHWRGK